MELALSSAIGVLVAAGIYLLLRARSFDVILGLTLLSYATNLLIFSAGRLVPGKPPVLRTGIAPTLANHVANLTRLIDELNGFVAGFSASEIVVELRRNASPVRPMSPS